MIYIVYFLLYMSMGSIYAIGRRTGEGWNCPGVETRAFGEFLWILVCSIVWPAFIIETVMSGDNS